jgi:predicted HTH domain antitoxin
MQIVVDVPNHYLDAIHRAPEDFAQEAKLAMAVKLFEMKRLSSGMAAQLIGMDRVSFLAQLPRFGVSVIDLEDDELASDVTHA